MVFFSLFEKNTILKGGRGGEVDAGFTFSPFVMFLILERGRGL
jgi:hypothetical protein